MDKREFTADTRGRLIAAMSDSLQCRGYHGVGINDILVQARAPKGVLYHHFPDGKVELADAAIAASVDAMRVGIERLRASKPDALAALKAWLAAAGKRLEASDFERGCPLAAVALESTAEDGRLREALARAFGDLRASLAQMLADAGISSRRATDLATLMVSAYEGALIQSRVAGNAAAVRGTAALLLEVVARELPAAEASA